MAAVLSQRLRREVVSRFLRDADIEVVAVDTDAADRALSAWRRHGKGRHALTCETAAGSYPIEV